MVRAGSQTRAHHSFSEAGPLQFDAVIASLLRREGILAAAVGAGLRDHRAIRTKEPDGCSCYDGTAGVRHGTVEASVAAEQCGGVRLRRELHGFRQRHDRSAAIKRLGKLLNERMWSAGYEGQLDVVPIFADGVVDDGPALQERFFFRFDGQNDAIRRLPDGHFADIADVEIAFAAAGRREGHAANVLIACGSDEAEVFSDFGLEIVFGDTHAGCRAQIDAAHFAGVGDQRDFVGLYGPSRGSARLSFNAQQFSGEGWSGGGADFHTRASEGG